MSRTDETGERDAQLAKTGLRKVNPVLLDALGAFEDMPSWKRRQMHSLTQVSR